MTTWKNDFIQVNRYTRPGDRLNAVRKIVVHYTANPGASAANHRKYFGGTAIEERRSASAHIFVDSKEAICIIPLNEVAYHANDVQKRNADGSAYRGVAALKPNANFLSIGVELCIEKDESFHPDTIKRATQVVKELCDMYNLDPIADVVRHYDVTSKYCPGPWVDNPKGFEQFKAQVKGDTETASAAPTQPAASTTTETDNLGIAHINGDAVNLRKGPGTDYSVIRKLSKGEAYKVYAEQNGWLNLGGDQWVYGDPSYIGFDRKVPDVPTGVGVVTVTADTLNVRSGPGTNYSVVKQVHKGEAYKSYGVKNGWYAVGNDNWVSGDYVTFKAE